MTAARAGWEAVQAWRRDVLNRGCRMRFDGRQVDYTYDVPVDPNNPMPQTPDGFRVRRHPTGDRPTSSYDVEVVVDAERRLLRLTPGRVDGRHSDWVIGRSNVHLLADWGAFTIDHTLRASSVDLKSLPLQTIPTLIYEPSELLRLLSDDPETWIKLVFRQNTRDMPYHWRGDVRTSWQTIDGMPTRTELVTSDRMFDRKGGNPLTIERQVLFGGAGGRLPSEVRFIHRGEQFDPIWKLEWREAKPDDAAKLGPLVIGNHVPRRLIAVAEGSAPSDPELPVFIATYTPESRQWLRPDELAEAFVLEAPDGYENALLTPEGRVKAIPAGDVAQLATLDVASLPDLPAYARPDRQPAGGGMPAWLASPLVIAAAAVAAVLLYRWKIR